MKRLNVIPHGSDEVIVVYEDAKGNTRNHLLRNVPELAEKYKEAAEQQAKAIGQAQLNYSARKAEIDSEAYAAADSEIAAAEAAK